MTIEYLWVAVFWAAVGGSFWFDCNHHNGWPARWRARNPRETGWNEALLIWLPVCMAGGPLWWVVFLAFRVWDRRAERR